MELWRTTALYCDGGCCERNPSPIGGTFAWCYIEDHEMIRGASGSWPKAGATNNLMEYMSALFALEAMPDGWSGYLCSDSQVTLGRLFSGWKLDGIPDLLSERAKGKLLCLGPIVPILLQGHPTKADLERGIGAKRNLPVSAWNRWCDERCREEAAKLLDGARNGIR